MPWNVKVGHVVLLAIVVAGLLLVLSGSAEPLDEATAKAVRTLMTKAYDTHTGLVPGILSAHASDYAAGAAVVRGEFFLPLRLTHYSPGSEWDGTVEFFADPEFPTARVGTVTIALHCASYDLDEMADHVLSVGDALGLTLEADPRAPNTYHGSGEEGWSLSVGLGESLVVVEVTREFEEGED